MPGVSIIIPFYNQSQYLLDAISSTLIQGLTDFEIILVNDGSNDAPIEFYDELNSQHKVTILTQSNKGAASARNLGVSQANKEYIAFLDADDLWLPGKLARQLEVATNLNKDIIFTFIEQFISPELFNKSTKASLIKNKSMPGFCASTLLVKKSVFEKVGYFNEQLKLGEFIDWYLMTKTHQISEHMIEMVFARRRMHKNNTSYRNQAHRRDYLKILHQRSTEKAYCNYD